MSDLLRRLVSAEMGALPRLQARVPVHVHGPLVELGPPATIVEEHTERDWSGGRPTGESRTRRVDGLTGAPLVQRQPLTRPAPAAPPVPAGGLGSPPGAPPVRLSGTVQGPSPAPSAGVSSGLSGGPAPATPLAASPLAAAAPSTPLAAPPLAATAPSTPMAAPTLGAAVLPAPVTELSPVSTPSPGLPVAPLVSNPSIRPSQSLPSVSMPVSADLAGPPPVSTASTSSRVGPALAETVPSVLSRGHPAVGAVSSRVSAGLHPTAAVSPVPSAVPPVTTSVRPPTGEPGGLMFGAPAGGLAEAIRAYAVSVAASQGGAPRSEGQGAEPAVRVRIGKIELHAQPAPAPEVAAPAAGPSVALSLDELLRRREGA